MHTDNTSGHQMMKRQTSHLETLRFTLSGAILGIAVLGLFSSWVYPVPSHDWLGAALGGVAVLIAKAKHLF